MVNIQYRFVMMLFRQDGVLLGEHPVTVDWKPAYEWAQFLAIRKGHMPPDTRASHSVKPIWHSTLGEPYMGGFQIILGRNGQNDLSSGFLSSYFKDLAEEVSSHFVANGTMKSGATFQYLMTAFADSIVPSAPSPSRLVVKETAGTIALCDTNRSVFQDRSMVFGDIQHDDIPVFIPRDILDETEPLASSRWIRNRRYSGGIAPP